MPVAQREVPLLDGSCFTRDDAAVAGIPGKALDLRLRRGELVQPLRGVYVDRGVDLDLPLRAAAAAKVLPGGAVVVRRAAAWLLGLDLRGPGELAEPLALECAVPVGREPMRRRGVVCYTQPLDTRDVAEVGGVPVTTPLRTACDLARWRSHWLGLSALDQMARSGLVSPPAVVAELARWRGERWVERGRWVAQHADARRESPGESWTHLRLLEAGFDELVPQVVLEDGGRFVARFDLADAARRVAWEYDGEEFHSAPEQRDHDAARRQAARDLGWEVWAFGKEAVLGRSLELELSAGEVYGREPLVRRRRW